ncbi:hypothetical protein [Aquisalimonas sp.]|uniref:hypothetical protein n=1 Tax=unclassified Aquisalimonas TaxID=2644645 RepID=UPI0025C46753|nr:hypothetical protein [Aquisalimonas sp.]
MRFLARRKPPFADQVASRFAYWIINRQPPPGKEGIEGLQRERRRHLQALAAQAGVYLSFGGLLALLAPQMAVIAVLAVLLLAAPTLWRLGRDWIALPRLFDPADVVEGLPEQVEQACERDGAVAAYRKRLRRMDRPILRIEAVAMVTVPDLDAEQWRDTAPEE